MRQLKFRAWDKEKKKYVNNFILAPSSPDWSSFPYEQAKDLKRYQKLIHEKIGDIDEEWKWELLGFVIPTHYLFDRDNYYGEINYEIEQFINKIEKERY